MTTRRTVTPNHGTITVDAAGTAWQDSASCIGHDPEFWFADNDHAYALRICRQCPVRQECLEHALTLPERYGVYGGMTAKARDDLRRRRGRGKGRSRKRANPEYAACTTCHRRMTYAGDRPVKVAARANADQCLPCWTEARRVGHARDGRAAS